MICINLLKQDCGGLETSDLLIHQLYQTTRAIAKNLNATLTEYGIFGSEWTILKIIKEKGSMTQVALANYLNIEPAAISKSLAKLEKKGFIERQLGSDKREKNILLTALAVKQYVELNEIVSRHRKKILIHLPEEKQEEMIRLLKTMYLNML